MVDSIYSYVYMRVHLVNPFVKKKWKLSTNTIAFSRRDDWAEYL